MYLKEFYRFQVVVVDITTHFRHNSTLTNIIFFHGRAKKKLGRGDFSWVGRVTPNRLFFTVGLSSYDVILSRAKEMPLMLRVHPNNSLELIESRKYSLTATIIVSNTCAFLLLIRLYLETLFNQHFHAFYQRNEHVCLLSTLTYWP